MFTVFGAEKSRTKVRDFVYSLKLPAFAGSFFVAILFGVAAVFLFAVLAAIYTLFLICKEEDVRQFLLNGGDAARVAAANNVLDLLGKNQILLMNDFPIFNYIDGDIVVQKGKYIEVQRINITFNLQNILFAHFIAPGIFDYCHGAV